MRDDVLPAIWRLRPDSFVAWSPLLKGPDPLAFEARQPDDFNWMERMI